MDPFLSLLHSFSSGLTESELGSLKFLCRDKIPKRKLEGVRSGMDLFGLLLEQRAIAEDSVDLLETLLRAVKRLDLVEQLQQFVEEGEANAPNQPDLNEKRLQKAAFDIIYENVGRDWKRLMRRLGLPEVRIENIEAAYSNRLSEQVFKSLREWQKWKGKNAKVADLIKGLRDCCLNLVADKVEQKLLQMNIEKQ
ncbi:PREDICTED: FAS-associated death domain protein [Tinamus guttatus]|uniref:FAS-associated death domain protein n=1 Tax=Tinamus guttatus TaxID=94827 RepID=UPI00052EB0C1|nr:PREDICTED: FAS-associated death domain protein [Tinamus guttatus]